MTDFSETQKEYLDKLFRDVTKVFNEKFNEKTTELKKELDKKVTEIKNELQGVINTQQERITILEDQTKRLKNTETQLQRKIRKNNLIVFGIQENGSDVILQVTTTLNNLMGIQILVTDISDAYRVGKKGANDRPIIIELISYQKKLLILRNTNKLKGKNVYVANDQCWEDREINKVLVGHLKEARKKGHQAYIKGNKIIIANEPYTTEDLEKNAVEIDDNINLVGKETEKNCSTSAPSTPSTQSGQKRLLHNISIEEEDKQEQKKPKSVSQKVKTTATGITTRSNSTSRK